MRFIRSGASGNRACCSSVCAWNPFTHAVELIRFALHGKFNAQALAITLGALAFFLSLAILGYSPAKGLMRRRAGGDAAG